MGATYVFTTNGYVFTILLTGKSLKIMERMVNQNTYDKIAQDFRYSLAVLISSEHVPISSEHVLFRG